MGKRSSPPPAPDYASLIPQQEQSNLNVFNQMLDAQRVNSITPFGRQTWYRPGQSPAQTRPGLHSRGGPVTFTSDGRAIQGGSETGQAPGGAPWTYVEELSPEQQGLYDQDLRIRAGQGDIAEGMLGRVGEQYATTPNFAELLPEYSAIGAPGVQGRVAGPGTLDGLDGSLQYVGGPFDRNRAEDAYYKRSMRFLEPELQQAEDRLHQRLVSQGFDTRGAAYGEQLRELGEQQGQLRADARDRAIIGGGQEASAELARILTARQQAQGERLDDWRSRLAGSQFDQSEAQRLFGQDLASSQFQQGEAQRQLAQALAGINVREQDRARGLNELNSFRTGQQIMLPGASPTAQTPNLPGIDLLGLANQDYAARLGGWNAQQANQGNFLQGLLGLGMGGLGLWKLFGK